MSEPSEEIANAMPTVPPQEIENPPPDYNFYLKMKPLRTLKLAIEALLDPNLSNGGFGVFGAIADNLIISVNINNINATAALFLKSAGMIEFRNNAPRMLGLLAPLHFISQSFPRDLDGDNDTVIIFHVPETNRLEFEFGTVPPTGFWAEIDEIQHVQMFPPIKIFAMTTVPVDSLKNINDCVLQQAEVLGDTVLVDGKEDFARIGIASDKKGEYDNSQNELTKTTGLGQGKICQCWFNWRYTRLMKEAFLIADKVSVHLLTDPEQRVLFQFHIGELADLFLLQKARLVIPDMSAEEGARDEDVSDSVTESSQN